ncbi:hypothetical protein Bca4012_026161 [Brassica carinata]
MEKTTITDGKPMIDEHRKLMEKTKLDEKIESFWNKYQYGTIEWYAEEHVKRKIFPEGFISKFLEDFNVSKAVMENNPPRVLDSEVEIARAEAIAANANKTSKKNKKINKTPAKKISTDFESVKQRLISSKSKERELSVAQIVMSRTAEEFSYVQPPLDSCSPKPSMSEEELRKVEEAIMEAKEKKERESQETSVENEGKGKED